MWVRIVALLLGSLALRPSIGAAIPLPLDAIDAAAADALAAAVAGPLRPDPAVQKLGDEILAYADRADGLTLRFTPVETPSSTALVLPNGSIYLSTKTLELLRGDVEKTSFVLASLGALAIDGGARDSDAVCEVVDRGGALPASFVQTVEATLTPERLYQADRLAMLCLARAGMPPLEGVRAIDDLARAGVRWTTTPKLPGVPTLLERKVKASQAAADLIKAATEFDFAVMDLVEKRYEDAIPRFKTFLEILPNNYAGWNNLGLCHYHLAIEPLGPPRFLLADAVAEFDTSYFTRGKRAPDDEHWQAALAAYQKASRLDPLRVEALINLGNLYLVTRDYQKGRHYFDLVLAQQPRNATALNNYGVALAEETAGDFPAEALAKFSSAAEADPTLPEAQFNLGLARAELGAKDAESAYRRYVALAPNGSKAAEAMRALQGSGGQGGRDGGATAQPALDPESIEKELELWNRVRLALAATRRNLMAMVPGTADQQRTLADTSISVMGWSSQGLVVELVGDKVNRVVAGRPPGHEAKTNRGVKVGYTLENVREKYGDPPAVSKQKPYDIWLYPARGLGFFVLGEQVNKIFLFSVVES